MTVGRKVFYLSSAVLLAGAMGVAQTSMGGSSQDQDSSMAGQAAGATLRGCLSGSAGNYTLTDHNGTIYHLVGAESQLQGAVGHEVQITGTPDARRSGATDDVASNTASSFQVTGARETAARCDHGSASGTMGTNSQPMTERPPSTDQQPKGAPGEGAPPPQPHRMALLQQPGNPSSVSTQPAQTGTPTTPQPGASNSTNSGVNGPSGTTTNPSATATPQDTQNDQNKPLYERQATDVPWASHSATSNTGSTTMTTTTNPNGASTTTTTTEPHL